eukprot:Lithocolla_globosa_v1_NODE_717_length_3393_cov_20.802454.p2 type:complete len:294 gc:universal NODE_717_length_3393_cov_20.802454:1892-1011(-)
MSSFSQMTPEQSEIVSSTVNVTWEQQSPQKKGQSLIINNLWLEWNTTRKRDDQEEDDNPFVWPNVEMFAKACVFILDQYGKRRWTIPSLRTSFSNWVLFLITVGDVDSLQSLNLEGNKKHRQEMMTTRMMENARYAVEKEETVTQIDAYLGRGSRHHKVTWDGECTRVYMMYSDRQLLADPSSVCSNLTHRSYVLVMQYIGERGMSFVPTGRSRAAKRFMKISDVTLWVLSTGEVLCQLRIWERKGDKKGDLRFHPVDKLLTPVRSDPTVDPGILVGNILWGDTSCCTQSSTT